MSSSPFSDKGEQGDVSRLPSHNRAEPHHQSEVSAVVFHVTEPAEIDMITLRIDATAAGPGGQDATTLLQPESVTDALSPTDSSSCSPSALPVHTLSIPALCKWADASEAVHLAEPKRSLGLSSAQAAARLARDGPNRLTPPPAKSEIIRYLTKYLDPFIVLLWLAGILCFVAYGLDTTQPLNMWVGVVLFIAVFISTTFTYIQEGKASAVMKSFKKMLPQRARVIRDGATVQLPAEELVIGDVVLIMGGDQVPADMRCIYTSDVKVENSSLTGESLPVPLNARASTEARLEEAKNVAFNSSKCLEGEAVGIVIATGDRTLIGRIASLVGNTSAAQTPIQVEMSRFVKRLGLFAVVLGVIFLIIGLSRGKPWIAAIINCFIVVIIACVPEGLPMTVTSCLTVTAKRMAEKNVFVKELRSVETLGSTTVIASDKTGTLTQNKMSVANLWFDTMPCQSVTVMSTFHSHLPSLPFDSTSLGSTHSRSYAATYNALELAAVLCNRTRYEDEMMLRDDEAVAWERSQLLQQLDASMTLGGVRRDFPTLLSGVEGGGADSIKRALEVFRKQDPRRQREIRAENASDRALFEFVKQRQNIELMRYHHQIVFELPFNSTNKYAITIVKPHKMKRTTSPDTSRSGLSTSPNSRTLIMKGAPEIILSKCSHYMDRGVSKPIDDSFRQAFQEAYEDMGGRGERVLGFAWQQLDEQQYPPEMDQQYSMEQRNFPMADLCFLGLISLVDPPKPSVPAAITMCRAAGIRVVMVTGDHQLTAASIARQVGIITTPTADQVALARGVPVQEVTDEECDAVVVSGAELDSFTESDWDRILSKREIVFARTTPQQKLAIVTHLQRLKHVVAVTGDGVNDSPALKKADVGIAMGIMGSDVAKDAADVILMDDDFSSIVQGVKEGRTIFDNLAKTIAYTLTHLVPETVPVLLGLAFDFPTALPSLAILAIDLGTELAPAVSFAYEPSESDVMSRPPRNHLTDRLVDYKVALYCLFQAGLVSTAWCYCAFLLVMKYYDIDLSRLPWSGSAGYFAAGAPNWIITGADGCDQLSPIPANCTFYNDSEQVDINLRASAAYFWLLATSQMFHILVCKTRSVSMFKHPMMSNVVMIYGIIIELSLSLLFIFTPTLNALLVGIPFPSKFWALLLLPGVTLLTWAETRKWIARKWNKGFVATHLNW